MCSNNKLDNSIAYLAGAIEQVSDGGSSYRQVFIDKCKASGLKIKFLDPTKKITSLTPDVGIEKSKIDDYRDRGDWENLRLLMKKIVKQDLRQVDISDMVIAFVNKTVYTCGTIEEIVTAVRQNKLVLIISHGTKKNCPAWLFGIIHYDFIFDTDDAAIEYLLKQNDGTLPLNDKLILFRKELDKLSTD